MKKIILSLALALTMISCKHSTENFDQKKNKYLTLQRETFHNPTDKRREEIKKEQEEIIKEFTSREVVELREAGVRVTDDENQIQVNKLLKKYK